MSYLLPQINPIIDKLTEMDKNGIILLLVGALIGFFFSILANQVGEWRRRLRNHKIATNLVGKWVAYNVEGRRLASVPMGGAGPTFVKHRASKWSFDSGELEFESTDIGQDGTLRPHHGRIVIDSQVPWVATRLDRYPDSDEVAIQRLIFSEHNPQIIFVFPISASSSLGDAYAPHAWRKKD